MKLIMLAFLSLLFVSGFVVQAQEDDRVYVSETWKTACIKHMNTVLEKNYKVGFNKGQVVCYSGFIDKTGGVTGMSMHRSSGSREIDQTALDLIQKAAPFPGNKDAVNYKVGVVVCFTEAVNLKFYPPTRLPVNYDVKQTYVKKWLLENAEKIKRYGIKKETDDSGNSKWVTLYKVEKPCSISFILGSNGEVTRLEVKESSGDSNCDAQLMKLIEHAAPYQVSSAGSISGSRIEVSFTGEDVQLNLVEQ